MERQIHKLRSRADCDRSRFQPHGPLAVRLELEGFRDLMVWLCKMNESRLSPHSDHWRPLCSVMSLHRAHRVMTPRYCCVGGASWRLPTRTLREITLIQRKTKDRQGESAVTGDRFWLLIFPTCLEGDHPLFLEFQRVSDRRLHLYWRQRRANCVSQYWRVSKDFR